MFVRLLGTSLRFLCPCSPFPPPQDDLLGQGWEVLQDSWELWKLPLQLLGPASTGLGALHCQGLFQCG